MRRLVDFGRINAIFDANSAENKTMYIYENPDWPEFKWGSEYILHHSPADGQVTITDNIRMACQCGLWSHQVSYPGFSSALFHLLRTQIAAIDLPSSSFQHDSIEVKKRETQDDGQQHLGVYYIKPNQPDVINVNMYSSSRRK